MAAETIKKILFTIVLLVLILPFAQYNFQFIKSGPLYGDASIASNADFSWRGWFDNTYQEKKTAYVNDNIGFRPDLVRLNNQLDYWLFNKLHVKNTLIGRDGYLFEKAYVEIYCGIGYDGESMMKEKLVKLKALQDTLREEGKKLLLVYAPSQARYYAEYLPEQYCRREGHPNLYRTNIRFSDSLGIDYIDFNSWFVAMREHTRHLLFSKVGVHWTHYGALIAADSIVHYLERADGIDMPDLVIDKMMWSDKPYIQEQDIANSLNLIFPKEKEQFSHPEYHFQQENKVKPKIIFLGDSFLWTFIGDRVPEGISSDWEFWYYFREVRNQNSHDVVGGGNGPVYDMNDYDWQASLSTAQYLVMVYTEANLWKIGDGFIEKAYEHYYGK